MMVLLRAKKGEKKHRIQTSIFVSWAFHWNAGWQQSLHLENKDLGEISSVVFLFWHPTIRRRTLAKKVSNCQSWAKWCRAKVYLKVLSLEKLLLAGINPCPATMWTPIGYSWNQGTLFALIVQGLRICFSGHFLISWETRMHRSCIPKTRAIEKRPKSF